MAIQPQITAAENRGTNQTMGFTTIQAAINNASAGDMILVPAGTYYEHVKVNKTVTLQGEGNLTTIIDGMSSGTVVEVTANNVTVAGFTIRNSGWGWTKNGILVRYADNCEIRDNRVVDNCHSIELNYSRSSRVIENIVCSELALVGYGVRLLNTLDCVAIGNNISDCIGAIHLELATNSTVTRNHAWNNNQGIRLYSPCTYNELSVNTIVNNVYDGMIDNSMNHNSTFFGNTIFHNNFINNTGPFILRGSGNIWHDGYPSGGNYWSRYNGADQKRGPDQNETGNDGIGDSPYVMNADNVDRYPLMSPWNASPVLNTDTSESFASIQEAVDANTTMNGHTLHVEAGYYFENVNLNKTVTLVGEGASKTFIDGSNRDSVISISAENVSITGFSIRNSGSSYLTQGMGSGVFLDHTSGCSIAYCTVTDNRIGIHAYFSTNSNIQHNNVYGNSENGIWLWFSGNNILVGNTMAENEYNFGVFGGNQTHFTNAVDPTNTVDGRPVRYLISAENEIISQADIGTLYLINCTNMTAQDLNLTRNGYGIFGYDLTDSKIKSVNTHDNNYGIFLQNSSNNTVEKCHCTSDWVGIDLQDSNDNRIEDNVAIECEKGILLYGSHRNHLIENTLLHNLYGIRLYSSSANTILHNNLLDNTEHANAIYSYENVWDNGCEGNYWSGYNGTDTDSDGVGDTYLPSNGLDEYPLMSPFMAGDVNHDGRINIFDVVKACASYMTTPPDSRWNPHVDIAEPYAVIDSLDIVEIVANYNLRWTPP